jgi:predicted site-specific integrase-resolvase
VGDMSWETLVVGNVVFKPSVPLEERRRIVRKIKEELELPSSDSPYRKYEAYLERYDDDYEEDSFSFQHVNWMSHVDEDIIENLLEEIKPMLKSYSISLYYLGESDADYYYDEDEEEEEVEAVV